MAKDVTKIFNDLIGLSGKFVDSQKGGWDQKAWESFLSDVQKQGLDMRDEMQSSLGSVLESMKKVYTSSISTKNIDSAMSDLTSLTAKFVSDSKGVWDHAQWEKYLKDAQDKGINLTEVTQSYIGGILESAKDLYNFLPTSVQSTSSKSASK